MKSPTDTYKEIKNEENANESILGPEGCKLRPDPFGLAQDFDDCRKMHRNYNEYWPLHLLSSGHSLQMKWRVSQKLRMV